ncbi:MAG: thioredoxin family protein [Clostridia bacterium]
MRLARALLFAAAVIAAPLARAEAWEAFFSPFLGDLRAELADARDAGRKGIVVMYHFDDCPYCARMKAEVLSRPEVQQAYARDFAAFAIDTRGALAITGADGGVLPERDYAKAQGVRGTPTFDFLSVDGKRLYRHVGALYDPADFILLERYVASGAYRSRTFTEYKLLKPKGT